jgi:hypothetical protein
MTSLTTPTAGTIPGIAIIAAIAFIVFVAVIAYALARSAADQWGDIDEGEAFGGDEG